MWKWIEFDIHRIKADAGTQFTSAEFQQACADSRIAVSFGAPNIKSKIILQVDHGNQ